MAKYDKEFKLRCIKAYEEGKSLPEVDGVLARSLKRYVIAGVSYTRRWEIVD